MTATNNAAKRIYIQPLAAQRGPSVVLAEGTKRFRCQLQAIVLVIGWFALLLVALWSEMAVVAAVQKVIERATFLHSSPPGHDVKPFRW